MYVCVSLCVCVCVHACVRACLLVCMHTCISATRAPKVQNHHTSQYQTIVNIFVGTLGSVHFLDYEFFLHGRISATRASINRDSTATHCNTLQHTAHWVTRIARVLRDPNTRMTTTLQHTATHCNAMQRTATHCTLGHTNGSCPLMTTTLQHTATHCNARQHTAHWATRMARAL